jgi:hypothetical protein
MLWLIVDGCLMLLGRIYMSWGLSLKKNSELTKNMFTLLHCQRVNLNQEKIFELIRQDMFRQLKELMKRSDIMSFVKK